MPANQGPLHLPGVLEKDLKDYCFYLPSEDSRDPLPPYAYQVYHDLLRSHQFAPHDFSASLSGFVTTRNQKHSGRMLVCRCFQGRQIAVAFRKMGKPIELPPGPGGNGSKPVTGSENANPPEVGLPHKSEEEFLKDFQQNCQYFPPEDKEDSIPFPVGLNWLCHELYKMVILREGVGTGLPRTGLVLVTGSTNSAKSEITRGLIYFELEKRLRERRQQPDPSKARRPHLLTYEDPVEKWLVLPPGQEPGGEHSMNFGIEYTPREKGVDVGSLKEAVDDALRQTPSVFYVGEVRGDEDWEELMRFAGTGHLVIATAHASSLIEAMERIFRGVHAGTDSERGQYAQRILGVVHLLKIDLLDFLAPNDGYTKEIRDILGSKAIADFSVLLPSVWRRTPAGVAALVSDGLSSVLPNRDRSNLSNRSNDGYSFGRKSFASALAAHRAKSDHWNKILADNRKSSTQQGHKGASISDVDRYVEALDRMLQKHAIRYDLMGL